MESAMKTAKDGLAKATLEKERLEIQTENQRTQTEDQTKRLIVELADYSLRYNRTMEKVSLYNYYNS